MIFSDTLEASLNRNAAIDLSRAFAVILVTMGHISRGKWLPSYDIGRFDLFGFLQNGWVGVGIFFVISGYCMGMSTKNDFANGVTSAAYFRYAMKRFMRIAPPYYVAIAVWVFIISTYKIAPKSIGIKDIITHMTFTHNLYNDTFFSISGVFWSIAVEMQFYLFLPFIVIFCKDLKSTILVLMLTMAISLVTYETSLSLVGKWGLLNYLCIFVYGLSLFKYKEYLAIQIRRFKLLPLIIMSIVILLLYKGDGYSNNQKLYELLAAFIYGLLMVGANDYLSSLDSPFLKVMLLIGKSSFSIYLYNYIYNSVMPRGENYFAMIFMIIGTIGFGVLMYLIIEVNTELLRKYLFNKNNIDPGIK